jgi:ElaB/YqjD/DUF883 family membrane-anchored ribosome-binding protein
MPNKTTSFKESVKESVDDDSSTLGEKLSDTAGQVKDKVSAIGHTAADKIDENRDAAAEGLEKAAAALHEKAEGLPGGEKVSDLAHETAEKLSSTADYVREHDVNSMMADVETLVRKNPGPALLAAAVIGFLVGRAFSSSD